MAAVQRSGSRGGRSSSVKASLAVLRAVENGGAGYCRGRLNMAARKYRTNPAGDLHGSFVDLVANQQPNLLWLMLEETLRSQRLLLSSKFSCKRLHRPSLSKMPRSRGRNRPFASQRPGPNLGQSRHYDADIYSNIETLSPFIAASKKKTE